MLVYIRCPTCGRILSRNLSRYWEDLAEIQSNPNLNKEQKEEAGAELLDKYGYRLYCCRQRILGQIPLHKYIVS